MLQTLISILTFRIPDPELKNVLPAVYNSLNPDLLTWRSLVSNALSDFYGIVGLARHFDILAKLESQPGLECIIRIQKPDLEVFSTSMSNYSFALGDFFGSSHTMSGRVLVVSHLDFLGMVGPI